MTPLSLYKLTKFRQNLTFTIYVNFPCQFLMFFWWYFSGWFVFSYWFRLCEHIAYCNLFFFIIIVNPLLIGWNRKLLKSLYNSLTDSYTRSKAAFANVEQNIYPSSIPNLERFHRKSARKSFVYSVYRTPCYRFCLITISWTRRNLQLSTPHRQPAFLNFNIASGAAEKKKTNKYFEQLTRRIMFPVGLGRFAVEGRVEWGEDRVSSVTLMTDFYTAKSNLFFFFLV